MTTGSPDVQLRRSRLLAGLLLGLTVATALGVCAVEAWRFIQPGAGLFAR